MEHDRALALLREHHSFPGAFTFRFVVRSDTADHVHSRLAERWEIVSIDRVPSRAGRFVSLRATVLVQDAEGVLTTYAEISTIEGVLTSM